MKVDESTLNVSTTDMTTKWLHESEIIRVAHGIAHDMALGPALRF